MNVCARRLNRRMCFDTCAGSLEESAVSSVFCRGCVQITPEGPQTVADYIQMKQEILKAQLLVRSHTRSGCPTAQLISASWFAW